MSTRGQALGLTVESHRDLTGLVPGPARGPTVTITSATVADLDHAWRDARPTPIHERRREDGELVLAISRDVEQGYRIEAPGHGLHLVAPDGGTVRSADVRAHPVRRLRLLHAQVLPLAATLQGHEVLHAGAIAWADVAIALIAPSGAGKSSLVAHLVVRGAEFVTDDALALTVEDDRVLAHPGPRFASFPERELAALSPEARARLGPEVGASDKPHLATPGVERALPLAALALVVRDDRRPPSVEPARPGLRDVLGATFVPYVKDRQRLERQLDMAARLVRSVPGWRISIPAGARAADIAALVLDVVGGEQSHPSSA